MSLTIQGFEVLHSNSVYASKEITVNIHNKKILLSSVFLLSKYKSPKIEEVTKYIIENPTEIFIQPTSELEFLLENIKMKIYEDLITQNKDTIEKLNMHALCTSNDNIDFSEYQLSIIHGIIPKRKLDMCLRKDPTGENKLLLELLVEENEFEKMNDSTSIVKPRIMGQTVLLYKNNRLPPISKVLPYTKGYVQTEEIFNSVKVTSKFEKFLKSFYKNDFSESFKDINDITEEAIKNEALTSINELAKIELREKVFNAFVLGRDKIGKVTIDTILVYDNNLYD